MPKTFDRKKINAVYNKINDMEKNRLLVKLEKRKKDTRWPLALAAAGLVAVYCFIIMLPSMRKI